MKATLFRESLKVSLVEMLRVLAPDTPTAGLRVQINASYGSVTFISETPDVIARVMFSAALSAQGVWSCGLAHLAEVVSLGGSSVELDATVTPGVLRVFSEGLSYEVPIEAVHTKADEGWFGATDRSNFMLQGKDIRAWACLRRIVDLGEPGCLVHAGTGRGGVVLDVHSDGLDLAFRGTRSTLLHRVNPRCLAVARVNTASVAGCSSRFFSVTVNGVSFIFKPLPDAPPSHEPAFTKIANLKRTTRGVRVDLTKLKPVLHTADAGSGDPMRQQVRVISGRLKLSVEYADAFPWKSDISETDGVEQWAVVVRLRELMAAVDQWDNRINLCVNRADPETPLIVSAVGGEASVIIQSRKPAVMAEARSLHPEFPDSLEDAGPP